MSFKDAVEAVGKGVDAIGVVVIVVGIALATARSMRRRAGGDGDPYKVYRQRLGRAICSVSNCLWQPTSSAPSQSLWSDPGSTDT